MFSVEHGNTSAYVHIKAHNTNITIKLRDQRETLSSDMQAHLFVHVI